MTLDLTTKATIDSLALTQMNHLQKQNNDNVSRYVTAKLHMLRGSLTTAERFAAAQHETM